MARSANFSGIVHDSEAGGAGGEGELKRVEELTAFVDGFFSFFKGLLIQVRALATNEHP
jgi:hypothetical protein